MPLDTARAVERGCCNPGQHDALPGSHSRFHCAGARGCTNRQQKAHITESRVVVYRWHPWHGRPVWVLGAYTKGGLPMVRCALEPDGNGMESEVPAWMFDGASCCRMTLAGAPSVAVSALLELRELVASAEVIESR